ncbi:hypothetical protein HDU86_005624 [Geranomyces michiganensis]|nr:hypothetical protein HDU86_005624 [Geranomyces michiganensis]
MTSQQLPQPPAAGQRPARIPAVPLTRHSFAPYGQVICALPTPSQSANQGTAQRYNHVAKVENRRAVGSNPAQPNLCVFRCTPPPLPFTIKLLERHPHSTQFFVPMSTARYLVIVALNDPATDRPDPTTLKAFVAAHAQGVSYDAGTWHHPMVAMGAGHTDFCVMVYERRERCEEPGEDCEEVLYDQDAWVTVDVPDVDTEKAS